MKASTKSIYDYYRTVKTKKEFNALKPNEICKTTNFRMFKSLFANRGKEKGFDEARVLLLIALMKSERFFPEISVLVINKNGMCIDGMNRIEAHIRTGLPLLFKVVFDDRLNGDHATTITSVATINEYDPRWQPKEIGATVRMLKNPLVKQFDNLTADLLSRYEKLSASKDLRDNLLMTLVERNVNKTHSRKRLLPEYYNDKFLAYSQTEEFKEELNFVCRVLSYFKDTDYEGNRMIEQVLFVMWGNENFNKNLFFHNLLKHNFKIKVTKSKYIREKIAELAEVSVPKKQKQIV